MFPNYGSKQWPIDLTCGEINIIDVTRTPTPEVEVVKVLPGAPVKKVRGVMPEAEFKWLKELGRAQRRLVFGN